PDGRVDRRQDREPAPLAVGGPYVRRRRPAGQDRAGGDVADPERRPSRWGDPVEPDPIQRPVPVEVHGRGRRHDVEAGDVHVVRSVRGDGDPLDGRGRRGGVRHENRGELEDSKRYSRGELPAAHAGIHGSGTLYKVRGPIRISDTPPPPATLVLVRMWVGRLGMGQHQMGLKYLESRFRSQQALSTREGRGWLEVAG